MKKWIYKYLLSPYILSAFLSVIAILSLPPLFDRYKIIPANPEISFKKNPDSYLIFNDIDRDSLGERIDCFYESSGNASIQVYDHNGAIFDQWSFRGTFTREREEAVVTGDYDNDGRQEIIVFTIRNDSIFFSCINKLDGSFRYRERYLLRISMKYSPVLSYRVKPQGFHDLNGDGFDELMVTVGGARSLQPRQVLAIDFAKDSVYASPSYGTGLSDLRILDIDKDGKNEVIGNTGASGNIPDSLGIPFSDYSAWFMVFDDKLELKFLPPEFPGFRNDLMVVPVRESNNIHIAALLNPVGTAPGGPVLLLFSPDGKILKEAQLVGLARCSRHLITNPFDPSNTTLLITEPEGMMVVDKDLHMKGERKFGFAHIYNPEVFDLQNDNRPEVLFTDETGRRLAIYHSFSGRPTVYTIPESLHPCDVSCGLSEKGHPVILLQKDSRYQVLTYGSNPLFYLRWAIYAGIYALILLFILSIRKLQQIQMERRQAIRDQILQLQLKTVHNQMDPHFTFNVFNSIANIIRNDEKESAFQSFLKFTGIVRSMLTDSDKIERKLEDEVRFVENYLELEKLRYKDRLNFEIRISPEVQMEAPVPKMILQIFAENAIKHGIRHRPEGGRLLIAISQSDRHLQMAVEDNGVGREIAKELSKDSTGMGLVIMQHYVQLFNELKGKKLHYEITDLRNDDGTAAGTRVTITI